ncbi:MAG: hypothetical protein IJE62_02360 [Clostridia bacterium]|nr:hypothetical protein [Clostridia bacterium]
MEDTLNIISRQPISGCLPDITKEIPCSDVDYICFEKSGKREDEPRYFLSIKSKRNISVNGIANCISEWILQDFEYSFAKYIFNQRFLTLYDDEAEKIIKSALESKYQAEKFYDKKILVKKLTQYLQENESISIDGFLRFRAKAYERRIEEYLFDATEEFFAEQEYKEFLQLIKLYLAKAQHQLGLLHIKVNCDGSFLLYDFKKAEVSFERQNFDLCNGVYSKDTELVSVLLTLNPKRIIWHNNCFFEDTTLMDSIKEIFEQRFAECNGCEFCIKK